MTRTSLDGSTNKTGGFKLPLAHGRYVVSYSFAILDVLGRTALCRNLNRWAFLLVAAFRDSGAALSLSFQSPRFLEAIHVIWMIGSTLIGMVFVSRYCRSFFVISEQRSALAWVLHIVPGCTLDSVRPCACTYLSTGSRIDRAACPILTSCLSKLEVGLLMLLPFVERITARGSISDGQRKSQTPTQAKAA